jgi:hypothetical protein
VWDISFSPGTADEGAQGEEDEAGHSGTHRYAFNRARTQVRHPLHVRERLILLEERLERVILRRSVLPVAFGLFVILALFLLRNEILGEPLSRATVSWILFFGVGAIFGITLNEITARRAIRNPKEEIEPLRPPYHPEALTSKTGRAS